STYDGMALAQAIVEYIHEEVRATTLFSTHYHELTELEETLAHVKNIYVRAEEFEDKIVFLHKVEEGRANESYGIHVAKLADLRSEEHTSELQSRFDLVCRLLLEKKKLQT